MEYSSLVIVGRRDTSYLIISLKTLSLFNLSKRWNEKWDGISPLQVQGYSRDSLG